MNDAPHRQDAPAPDHAIVQVSRRAAVARARFERELDALLDDLHAAREAIHGQPLPYEPPAEQHEDTP